MWLPPLFISVINLSNFFIDKFPNIDWYPFWYLGNPYRFLTGPVIPFALYLFSLVSIPGYVAYCLIIALSLILGGLGLFFYFKFNGVSKSNSFFPALCFIFIPIMYIVLPYQNGLKYIAIGIYPLLFLLYQKSLISPTKLKGFISSFIITFILLINSSSFLPLFIALIALVISEKDKGREKNVLELILFISLAISLSLFWYTPEYIGIILMNPSIGGLPLIKVSSNLFNLLFQLLPIIFALLISKFKYLKLSGFKFFSVTFFASLVFLSFIRFIADPDFIMDWTGFFPEIQLALAMVISSFSKEFKKKGYVILATVFILFYGYIVLTVYHTDFSNGFENKYKTRIEQTLSNNVKPNNRIFLSGNPVFWLSDRDEIMQVRGGNDLGSINTWWMHGAYQIREGDDASLAAVWLRIFGVSYILINSKDSEEYFKDFKNIERYRDSKYFSLQYYEKGNFLYKVKNSALVRIADVGILSTPSPRDGADVRNLLAYAGNFKQEIEFRSNKSNQIIVSGEMKKDEVISLAVSFDRNWKIEKGEGRILGDALDNIVIMPEKHGKQEFILKYKRDFFDWAIPMIFSMIIIFMIYRTERIILFIKRIISKFSLGLQDDY